MSSFDACDRHGKHFDYCLGCSVKAVEDRMANDAARAKTSLLDRAENAELLLTSAGKETERLLLLLADSKLSETAQIKRAEKAEGERDALNEHSKALMKIRKTLEKKVAGLEFRLGDK